MLQEVSSQHHFMGRLNHGEDLLEALNQACRQREIRLGRVTAIGAVQKAALGYYDQSQQVYHTIHLDRPLEIVQLTGNISTKDDRPFIHAHATFSDASGRIYGGHLFPGTIIFACEVIIHVFQGPAFQRILDDTTGLPLWRMP
ncbi:MAG: DNA-binding protein [Magnetococcales bacterium]|nr:DNA-binding protein [Magnetococcales bacterium]HIJ84957.1 DNA-binding protein [Magnetococcales bacterium]